jgi:choline dehydrogenase-like flavoprotein
MRHTSVWVDTGPQPDARPRLETNADADVAVIGGGIVGITTALLLQEAGVRVVPLEAGPNEAALAWMAARVERDGIDCDFRRRASYAYLGPDSDASQAERETEAALEAGLPASLVEDTPLPYPVAAAAAARPQPLP